MQDNNESVHVSEAELVLPNDEFSNEPSHFDSIKVLSPTGMVIRRFFRSRLSLFGLAILITLFLFCFVGPLFVPYGETEIFTIPTVQKIAAKDQFVGVDGQTYIYYDVSENFNIFKAAPSKEHWLGTDPNGMDVFVRLMYGGRISLTISFIVVFLETLIGVFLGGIAGYFGKWVDTLIMRIVDIFNCLPGMPILLIASAILRAVPVEVIPADNRIYWLMGILTLFGWSGAARLVRGQILSLREQEFMLAAEATGITASKKIVKHLIPNVMPQLIVSMTLGLGSVILYEATLSYLGLGVQIPKAAWGTMISLADPSKGQEILAYFPNLWVPAGVLIVLTVLAFNFVGDGLRDAFDPKMKR